MVEHVGEKQIDEYAAQIARVLAPGGRVLNHGITYVPPTKGGAHIGGDFSNRYVFPDGELLNLSRMLSPSSEPASRRSTSRTSTPTTPRRFGTGRPASRSASTRPSGWRALSALRVWRLYLRAARNSFETAHNAVYQLLCSRPLTEGPSVAPTGAASHEPARRRVPPGARPGPTTRAGT